MVGVFGKTIREKRGCRVTETAEISADFLKFMRKLLTWILQHVIIKGNELMFEWLLGRRKCP